MFKNATPEKAIAFLRFSMASAFFLPLNSHANRLKTTCYNILKFLAFLNSFLSLYPVINALQTFTDPMDVSESAVYLIGVLLAISHTVISIVRSNNIRNFLFNNVRRWHNNSVNTCFCNTQVGFISLLNDIVEFGANRRIMVMELTEDVCKNANDHARRLFQRYMEQFSTFYGVLIIWSYVTGMTFILKALIMSDPYPLKAVYPFRVDYQPLKTIIFLHQSLYICNVSGNSSVNVFCGFLLFFAAARFEILKMKLHNVKNTEDLIIRMEEYYVVKEYANFAVNIVKFVAPCAVILAVVALLMCGMNLLQPQPLTVKMQYISVAATVGVTIFMFAWPADNLLYQSGDAMQDIFQSAWYNQSKKMQQDIQIMMVPQTPVAVQVPCIISTLSLNFFCTFISNVFSAFSVLRAAISEDENT